MNAAVATIDRFRPIGEVDGIELDFTAAAIEGQLTLIRQTVHAQLPYTLTLLQRKPVALEVLVAAQIPPAGSGSPVFLAFDRAVTGLLLNLAHAEPSDRDGG